MISRLPLRALLPAAAAVLTACGREAPVSPATGRGGLEFTSDRPDAERPAPRVLSGLRFAPDTATYELRDGEAELLPDPLASGDEGWQLALRGRGLRSVALPGSLAPGGFERLAVELTAEAFCQVQAIAVLEDGSRLHSVTEGVDPAPDRQITLLDLPALRLSEQAVSEVLLQFRTKTPELLLHRVDWISQPAGSWLPHAGEAPRHLMLAGESRLVTGFTSEETLSARAVARPGEEVSFCYGVPSGLGVQGGLLRVSATAGGETVEREYPLGGVPGTPGWQEASVPLDGLAGGDLAGNGLELRFTLVSPVPEPAVCAVGDVRLRDPRAAAPLVFLMTSDTHRADHIGVAGLGVEVDTPTIDALAARGVWFGNCYTSTNVTNPSHVALMTGAHPRDHGVVTNGMSLAEQAPTLAEAFRAAGWATFGVVSNSNLGPRCCGLEQGFARFATPAGGAVGDAGEAVDRLLEWWPSAQGVPLFCWLHVFDAHTPYDPPDPSLVERYYPAGQDPFDPARPPLEGVDVAQLPRAMRGLRDLAWPRATYRAEVTYLDRELGRLIAQPRFAEAVIAVTADHGETLDTHDAYYSHADLYPDNLHVPLILCWPEAPGGARVEQPVEQIWLGRTLLDLAGLDATPFPGQDLRAHVGPDAASVGPRFALSAGRRTASITAWPWHLTLHLRPSSNPGSSVTHRLHATRLYDLEHDPAALRELVAEDQELERARRLRERLITWLNSAEHLGWGGRGTRNPDVLAELAKLGYATDDPETTGEELVDPGCDCTWCRRLR